MFKSAEEREAERRERDAEQAKAAAAREEKAQAAAQAKQRAALLATPVGAATAAKQQGDAFFEIQLDVGVHSGRASFGTVDSSRSITSSAGTLGEIERLGWRLEHAGYFFMMTGETSSQRVFATGDATAVSGRTIGVYLFRNTDTSTGTGAGA